MFWQLRDKSYAYRNDGFTQSSANYFDVQQTLAIILIRLQYIWYITQALHLYQSI